ncbi:MFS transporter [Microbacterium sp. X-17]|uniref:MFS transporter n=1 Tax=Microbacterium sp. X-17 TaxID=3144404 RepID=UPI0031F53BF9
MSADLPARAESAAAAALAEPSRTRVGVGFIAIYLLAMFGIWMSINLPASVTIALRIGDIDPENKTGTYSLVAGVGTLIAVLANPFFGRLSDRTRSRFGRRRPWIVVGVLGTAAGAAVIGLSNTVPLMIIGWVLMQGFVNAAIAAALAIVADRIPEEQQGFVGSLSGLAGSLSIVVGIFFIQIFPTSILAQIGLPVLAAVVFGGLLVIAYRDDTPAQGPRVPFGFKEFLGSFYVNPRSESNFTWLLVSLFLVACGFGVVSTYTVYFLQDQIAVPADDLAGVLTLAYLLPGVVAVVATPLAGWVGDRLGRRKPVVIAAALSVAGGIVVIVTATSPTQFVVGVCLVSGVGAGALMGTFIALAIATMTSPADAARNLGIANIAVTLPFSIVPFVAPLLLGIGSGANYTLLFLAGGVVAAAGIIPLVFIRNAR